MNAQQHNAANNPALQGQMAAAILNANKEMEAKQTESKHTPNTPVPAIVVRKDLLGNRILFLADTQDLATGSIQYWDGKKGSKPATAPIEFYKSTKPIENGEEVKKLVQDYSKEFQQKEVVLRQRLIKSTVLNRDEQGNTEKVNVDDYKQRLLAAVTKAINETL